MSDELKLALESLKIKLETDLLRAQNEREIVREATFLIDRFAPVFEKIVTERMAPVQAQPLIYPPRPVVTSSKENLLFYANLCGFRELEAFIDELHKILEQKLERETE